MARTSLSEIEQRNNRTLEYMHNHSSVTVEELAQYLQVSTVTVRRDLNYLLNEKWFCGPVQGIMRSMRTLPLMLPYSSAIPPTILKKTAIARAALDLIPSGERYWPGFQHDGSGAWQALVTEGTFNRGYKQSVHSSIPLPAPKSKAVFWLAALYIWPKTLQREPIPAVLSPAFITISCLYLQTHLILSMD